MNDCVTNPPKEAGRYNVSIHNVRTLMPIFWYYDGERWTRHDWAHELKEGVAVWYPNK